MIFENKNGMITYYEVYGDEYKPSLLLLHGIGGDHKMWHMQKDFFENKGFRVIIPDLLAHGKSSKVETLCLDDWSKQLEDLMNYLKVDKVTLIGVSMGGVIAQHFAVSNPNRVERLIISDSFGKLKSFSEKMMANLQVIGFRIFKILGHKLLAKGMASTYKAEHAKFAKKYFRDVCLTIDLKQMVLARKAINKIDALEKLKTLNLPSMVLVGEDFGQSFVEINRKIAIALGVKLIVIEKAMDPTNLVNPQAFNAHVIKFLDETKESIINNLK